MIKEKIPESSILYIPSFLLKSFQMEILVSQPYVISCFLELVF